MTTLQGRIDGMAGRLAAIEHETVARWPIMTKFGFRQLLTNEQMLMWDNWLDMELGLTQQEKWQMNSFFKSFDTAEKVTMTDPMMTDGMAFFVAKGLLTQDESDRILAGYQPDKWPPVEEEVL